MSARPCPDCDRVPRRRFLQATAAISAVPILVPMVHGAPSRSSQAESVVAELYESFNENQKKEVCRSFGDPLRQTVNANWHVTKPLIGSDFYTKTQQGMIEKIVQSLTSDEGYRRLKQQMDEDDGGLDAYSIAIFGQPQQGEFEWVLTGRHLTLRADGDTVPKTAFGGGIVYGHGEESSPEANLFYFQTKAVNEVFKSLDKDQRSRALITSTPPSETDIEIRGSSGKFAGIAASEFSRDQMELFRTSLATLLGPYRDEDSDEAMRIMESGGGLGELRLAFYQQEDLGNDSVWDIWRIEGPNSVIHFRGAPHVHAYIHIVQAT
jgi:Protein of unknown function (DUF3500)